MPKQSDYIATNDILIPAVYLDAVKDADVISDENADMWERLANTSPTMGEPVRISTIKENP